MLHTFDGDPQRLQRMNCSLVVVNGFGIFVVCQDGRSFASVSPESSSRSRAEPRRRDRNAPAAGAEMLPTPPPSQLRPSRRPSMKLLFLRLRLRVFFLFFLRCDVASCLLDRNREHASDGHRTEDSFDIRCRLRFSVVVSRLLRRPAAVLSAAK